jgi:hypothetical protein
MFNKMPIQNVVTWITMIWAHVNVGKVKVVRPLLTNAKSFGMPYLEDVPSMGMVRKLLTF